LLKCNTPIAVVLCRWNLPVVSQQIYVVHFIFQCAYPENCEEEFEDTKGVIRIRKSKKNRQHNGPRKKDERRSAKHTHNAKDRVP
jgi:hypothetical protein